MSHPRVTAAEFVQSKGAAPRSHPSLCGDPGAAPPTVHTRPRPVGTRAAEDLLEVVADPRPRAEVDVSTEVLLAMAQPHTHTGIHLARQLGLPAAPAGRCPTRSPAVLAADGLDHPTALFPGALNLQNHGAVTPKTTRQPWASSAGGPRSLGPARPSPRPRA